MGTDGVSAPIGTPRVVPRVRWGVLAYVAYLVVFLGAWISTGIQYDHIADDAGTLTRWYVAPLAAGTITIAVIITIFRWWRPVLFDAKRLLRWPAVLPAVLLAVVAVVAVATSARSDVTPLMWLLLIAGSVLVGFNEEIVTRGVLVVALRSRFGELGVWLLSSALFAALHLPNGFFGVGPGAVVQALFAFGFGSAAYLLRRYTGSLLWAMLLHGLWDFATFSSTSALVGLQPFIGALAVVTAAVVLTRGPASTRDANRKAIR